MGGHVTVERVQGNTFEVIAEIGNAGANSTRLEVTEMYDTGRPARVTVTGSGRTGRASGFRAGDLGEEIALQLAGHPSDVVMEGGVLGRSWVTVTWIVSGTGDATREIVSQKGGVMRRGLAVR